MEYDRILGDALRLTWRYKFLWIFALLGGGTSSSCGGAPSFNFPTTGGFPSGSGPSSPRTSPGPGADASAAAVQQFLAQNWPVILGIGLMLTALALVLIVLSFIARGALIWSVGQVSRGEPAGFRSGWANGERLGWRYFRLWLLEIAIGILITVLVAIVIGILVVLAQLGDSARVLAIIAGVLLGLAGFVAAIIFFIAFTVVIELAERAIGIDDFGARSSLRYGYELLRANLWPSALVWVISIAIAIAAGIVLLVPAAIVGIPMAAAVVGSYAAAGLTAPTIAIGLLAVLIFIAVIWVLGSVSSAYLSSYWTLVYLSLTKRYPPAPPPPTVPEPEPVPTFT